jgi:hypothetical protein
LIYSLIYRNKRRVFLLPSLQIFAKWNQMMISCYVVCTYISFTQHHF